MEPPEGGISFPQKLWKSLWKRRFLSSQISEIHGLVALCTHFVQNQFTAQSLIISVIIAAASGFWGFLWANLLMGERFC
jgi:hypothetical protein